MQTIQNILTQLGMAAVNSFWQVGLLWIVYQIIIALGHFSAGAKFRVALSLSLAGSVWFLASLIGGLISPGYNSTRILQLEALLPDTYAPLVNLSLGATYLVFLAFFLVKGRTNWVLSKNLRLAKVQKAPASLRMFVNKYATWMEIPRKVSLVISSVHVPATLGWLKPVILLPSACMAGLTPYQLESILLHELAHIRRNDYLWGMVIFCCETVLWFNPFLGGLAKEARMEAEKACDDWVLQFEFSPREYAYALLQAAKTQQGHAFALAANGHNEYQLLGRIRRVLGLPLPSRKFGWKELLSAGALLFFSFLLNVKTQSLPSGAIFPSPARFPATAIQYFKNKNQQVSYAQISAAKAGEALAANAMNPKQAEGTREKLEEKKVELSYANNKPVNKKLMPLPLAEQVEGLGIEPATMETEGSPLMLSAGWASQLHESIEETARDKAWDRFETLLDKLEYEGELMDQEWNEITRYIAFHSEIREAIYEEARRQSAPLQPALQITEQEKPEKILLIVFDEASRTLAASLVNIGQFAEEYQIPGLSDLEQQVVFLHKKARKSSKIISL